MTYDWYKIFNKAEFESEGLVSKNYEVELEDIGIKDILVTKGNLLNVSFDENFMPLELNDKNPFEFDDVAVYLDENDDVWIGYLQEEE